MKASRIKPITPFFAFMVMALGSGAASLLGLLCSCNLAKSFDAKPQSKAAQSISLSSNSLKLQAGAMEILNLSVKGVNQDTAQVVWHYDEKILSAYTDNYSAVITGLVQGSTTVRAEVEGLSASCVVTVEGQAKSAAATNPYVFCETELLIVAPGEEKRVIASLAGVSNPNLDEFSFSIDKPSVAGLSQTGNYCLITGGQEGLARVTISHARAAFSYSFLVSTQRGEAAVPYLTVDKNIIIINRSREGEKTIHVSMLNPPSPAWESGLSYNVTGDSVEAAGAGPSCLIRALKSGDSLIRVSHEALAYPLEIFVRVVEEINEVYIQSSHSVLSIKGAKTEILSASLKGLSEDQVCDPSLFTWTFSPDAEDYASFKIYDNEVWLSAKRSGALKVTIAHPLSPTPCEVAVLISDIAEEAARASTYISTNQNYVSMTAGQAPVGVSVQLINAAAGEEERLSWSISSFASDDSGLPVLRYVGGTGKEKQPENKQARSTGGVAARDIAEGLALFEALRPGRAEVIVTHPLALYPTKLLFHVEGKENPRPSLPSRAVRIAAQRPYLTTRRNVVILDKNTAQNISVSAIGIDPRDYKDMLWSNSNSSVLSLTANGPGAGLIPLADEGEALLTITHPLAANSLEIYVSIGERYAYKNKETWYIATESDVLELRTGNEENVFRVVLASSMGTQQKREGFSFRISDPETASVYSSPLGNACFIKALKPGRAILTINHREAVFNKEVLLMVRSIAATEEGTPFLSADKILFTLAEGEKASCTVRLENALSVEQSSLTPLAWTWVSDSPHTADIVSFSGGTALLRAHSAGTAAITIRHEASPAPLRIIVSVSPAQGAEQEAAQAWLKLSASLVNLEVGGSAAISASLAGAGTEAAQAGRSQFVWQLSDSSLALIEDNGGEAVLRGLKAGTTYLHVSHSLYPETCSRTIIVNVKEKATDGCFISLDQQIVKLKPFSKEGVTIHASLENGQPLDARDFEWWTDDPGLVLLTALNDTANILPLTGEGAAHIYVRHHKAETPVSVLVLVSSASEFAFALRSKTIRQGSFSFIPLYTPPSETPVTIEYTSSYEAVCSVVGSNRVAMLAGLEPGHAEITARLLSSGKLIAETSLAVIVERTPPEPVELQSRQTVLSLEKGASLELNVSMTGKRVKPNDQALLQWESNDSSLVSLEQSQGSTVIVKAHRPGEAVISVSHPHYPEASLCFWIVVPQDAQKLLFIDQTSLLLCKDDGAQTLSATILNGRDEDYAALVWSASKMEGYNVVTLGKAKGKECALIPRSAGTTVITAELPTGQKALCTVTVLENADIHFDAQSVTVNPRYTATIKYRTRPENASLTWASQTQGVSYSDPEEAFAYTVNEAEGSVSITGIKPGKGRLSAFFASSAGVAAQHLDVIVAYTYSITLETKGTITAEPRPGVLVSIPFKVFPPDLKVEAASSDESRLRFLSLSTDKDTGKGEAVFEALKEGSNLVVRFKAVGKNAEGNDEIRTASQNVRLAYKELEPKLIFADLKVGAYSNWQDDAVNLGDGEEMLFYVDFGHDNVEISEPEVKWIFSTGSQDRDNREADFKDAAGNTGLISLTQEAGSGKTYWRLKHGQDHQAGHAPYYYFEHDMYYKIQDDKDSELRTIGTEWGQGITAYKKTTHQGWMMTAQFYVPCYSYQAESQEEALRVIFSQIPQFHVFSNGKTMYHDTMISRQADGVIDYWKPEKCYSPVELLRYAKQGLHSAYFESLPYYNIKNYTRHFIHPYPGRAIGPDPEGFGRGANHMRRFSIEPDQSGIDMPNGGHFEIVYERRAATGRSPVYIAQGLFEQNPNWYKPADNALRPEKMHDLARLESVPTFSAAVERMLSGSIEISYKDVNGKRQAKTVPVSINIRHNKAYSSHKWLEVEPGRWEER
jgi:hypothetical protein